MKNIFTSKRERQLWTWILLVVIAIYSTLGLAGKLVAYLPERHILDQLFFGVFLILLAAILASGLLKKRKPQELWVIVGVACVYLMTIFRMGLSPLERSHLFEYGLVGGLIYYALLERQKNGRKGMMPPAIMAIVSAGLLGWIDEGIQNLLPNRVYDIRDVFFNGFAAFLSVGASFVLRRIGKN